MHGLSKVKIEIFLGALFKSDACVKREIIFYIDSAVGGGDLAHFHKYTVAKRNFYDASDNVMDEYITLCRKRKFLDTI